MQKKYGLLLDFDGVVVNSEPLYEKAMNIQFKKYGIQVEAEDWLFFKGKDAKAQKCNMCAEKLDQGDLPACVEACPVDALKFVETRVSDAAGMAKTTVGFKPSSMKPSIRFYPKFRSADYIE